MTVVFVAVVSFSVIVSYIFISLLLVPVGIMCHRSGGIMCHRSGGIMCHRSGGNMCHRSGGIMCHRSGGIINVVNSISLDSENNWFDANLVVHKQY